MKIGLLPGSFNPIHIGHLALANWICEYGGMDEVWFLVTPQNPWKEREVLLDDNLRYELVERAIAPYPRFKLNDIEFTLPRPSYTINTLDTLQKQYPRHIFYLTVGADNWMNITQWKDSQRILSEYQVLVYPRKGYPAENSAVANAHLIAAPEMEISSTFIREAICSGKDIRFFLPEAVRSYIPKIREALYPAK